MNIILWLDLRVEVPHRLVSSIPATIDLQLGQHQDPHFEFVPHSRMTTDPFYCLRDHVAAC